jgi:hypothetical protein
MKKTEEFFYNPESTTVTISGLVPGSLVAIMNDRFLHVVENSTSEAYFSIPLEKPDEIEIKIMKPGYCSVLAKLKIECDYPTLQFNTSQIKI